MGDIVIPKCPSCGAPLDVDLDKGIAKCEYCGTEAEVIDNTKLTLPDVSPTLELEKMQLALQMAQRDLQQLQSRSYLLQSQIDAIEHPRAVGRKAGLAMVYVFGIMAIFMTAMLGGLFYFLQIYYIYGLTKTTCPLLMVVVIVISVVLMVVMTIASKVAAKRRYDAGISSPEYPKMVAEFNDLQPKIQAAQAEVAKRDQDLKSFVR